MNRRGLLALGAGVVVLRGVAWAWLAAAEEEVTLDGEGGAWHLRVTLDSRERATFLLDTGATLCVVSERLARRLGLKPTGEVQLRTANGEVKAPLARLRTVDVGDSRARDVDAVVHDAVASPVEGILGLNFLNRFQYAIDPKRKVLRLR